LKYLGKLALTVKRLPPFNFDFELLLIPLSKIKDYEISVFHLGKFSYGKVVNISLRWQKSVLWVLVEKKSAVSLMKLMHSLCVR